MGLITALVLSACNGKGSQKTDAPSVQAKQEVKNQYESVEALLQKADKIIDQEVQLTAIVSHTCSHAGKRCFLMDAEGKETIRIEAGGKINGFNQELMGKTIKVKGVVKQRKLTKEYIDQWEEAIQENAVKEDGTTETCNAENNNIEKMRSWMKANGKEYYYIYFIEGQDYDIVQ